MKMVFATGGTGGHIMPAIAIREAAIKSGHEVAFIHSGREIEKKLCNQFNISASKLSSLAFTGKSIWQRFLVVVLLPFKLILAIRILRRERPEVVVGFGGYVSFVPVFAAVLLGIRTAIQEQNGSLGLANRILALFVDRVFVPEHCMLSHLTKPYPAKYIVLNNPVRSEFSAISDWSKPVKSANLLAIGGSQGAVSLNSALIGAVKKLIMEGLSLSVVHQTGSSDKARVEALVAEFSPQNYRCIAFTDEMPRLMAESTLIVSRAGAMSAAEIGAAGRPAVFVPLNIARAHQLENVLPLEQAGAAQVVIQDENLEENLFLALKRLLIEDKILEGMAMSARSIKNRFNTANEFVVCLESL